jgi:hypothetical protein
MQCTYNVIWLVRVIILQQKLRYIVCVIELHVIVNYIKTLGVAQQCFYGTLSLATMQFF